MERCAITPPQSVTRLNPREKINPRTLKVVRGNKPRVQLRVSKLRNELRAGMVSGLINAINGLTKNTTNAEKLDNMNIQDNF